MIKKGTFQNCYSLKSVIIPSSVKTIDNHAFMCCGSLEEIVIPPSVIVIGIEILGGCESLTKITIPSSLKNTIDYLLPQNVMIIET